MAQKVGRREIYPLVPPPLLRMQKTGIAKLSEINGEINTTIVK